MTDFCIDNPPTTEAEKHKIRVIVRRQAWEVVDVETRVTCPCGNTPRLIYAHKCFYCGIYFCRRCAARQNVPSLRRATRSASRRLSSDVARMFHSLISRDAPLLAFPQPVSPQQELPQFSRLDATEERCDTCSPIMCHRS